MLLAADAAARTSADYEIEIDLSADDWTPAGIARVCGQMDGAANRAWYLQLDVNGAVIFNWSADGAIFQNVGSAILGIPDGARRRIRITFDSANGGGNREVQIYLSADGGLNWTLVTNGTGIGAGPSTIYASTAAFTMGAAGGVSGFTGNIYELTVRDGIAGPALTPLSVEAWGSADSALSALNSLGGSPTLYCTNGSKSGGSILGYFSDAGRFPKMVPWSTIQTVVVSTNHNDMAGRAGAAFLSTWTDFITQIRARSRTAAIWCLTQNPRVYNIAEGRKFFDEVTQQAHALPLMSQRLGIGCIDTYRAFGRAVEAGATLSDLVADGIHPTAPAGVDVWINAVWDAWRRDLRR